MTAFVILLFVTIIAAVVVVTTRNIVHAAVFLALSFVGVAGIYLLLDAPFIAGAQVLIYAGAITVLILFALMLTAQTVMRAQRHDWEAKVVAGVVAFVLFGAVLLPNLTRANWPLAQVAVGARAPGGELGSYHSVAALAKGLLGTYLFAFEVASVLLLVALVGAIVLAKEERA